MERVYIGYDSREPLVSSVCMQSLLEHDDRVNSREFRLLKLSELNEVYHRPMRIDAVGQLMDVISDKPMATQFALSRFFIPHLPAGACHWALFCDNDFMFRADVSELFKLTDPKYAMMVVKHPDHQIADTKLRGQSNTWYPRKNWSSLMLWNLRHPAHKKLTLNILNTAQGLALHQFCWLKDSEIGALPPEWNWLQGVSDPAIQPKAVHFTHGTPDMGRYNTEWLRYAKDFL